MGGRSKTSIRIALGMSMILRSTRVVFLEIFLSIFRQHIHPKPFLGMQMSVGTSALVHANQYQRRIEGKPKQMHWRSYLALALHNPP